MTSRYQTPLQAIVLLSGLLLASCGSSEPLEPSNPDIPGQAQVTLLSPPQAVPGAATDALVRLWNSSTGFDARERVSLPDPGSSTEVNFSAPSGSSYQVGVVVYREASPPEALAGGVSSEFLVAANETTEIPLTVEPWELDLLEIPDTLVSGAETTIRARIVAGPPSILAARFGATLCFDSTTFSTPCSVATPPAGSLNGEDIEVTFSAPTGSESRRVYFQFSLGIDGREWTPEDFNVGAGVYLPSITLGDTLISRPIETAAGSVVVIIS